MLPAFDPTSGRLPPGERVASWDEVVERFGWTERRLSVVGQIEQRRVERKGIVVIHLSKGDAS